MDTWRKRVDVRLEIVLLYEAQSTSTMWSHLHKVAGQIKIVKHIIKR